MYPKAIQSLIDAFVKFPTIGSRTASRFAFYLLKASDKEIDELLAAISELSSLVALCLFCYNPYENKKGSQEKLCVICKDAGRNQDILCVVEKESDVEAIEKSKYYHGIYFILGGTICMLKTKDMKRVRVKELIERVSHPAQFGLPTAEFKEIILATNPTIEGEATALYVERQLKLLNIKITRLGRGIPIGGELEYADEETLYNALEGRR